MHRCSVSYNEQYLDNYFDTRARCIGFVFRHSPQNICNSISGLDDQVVALEQAWQVPPPPPTHTHTHSDTCCIYISASLSPIVLVK